MRWVLMTLALCAMVAVPAVAAAQSIADRPGTISVPAFELPLSEYLSPEARADMTRSLSTAGEAVDPTDNAARARDIAQIRASMIPWTRDRIASLRARHDVALRDEQWGGVPVIVVEPATSAACRPDCGLLIGLHAGGFILGSAETFGLLEAIPVAAMTGATVVAVNYRQGPEHRFPAASEDVAAVYQHALTSAPAHRIGLFGCSSGGVLVAEALVWFQREGLPTPGAAGIFCAGADARYGGDSRFVAPALNGSPPPDRERFEIMEDLYYGDVDFRDPLVSPVFDDETLRAFPPTLLITATRASDLSAAVYTHSRLVALGVEADLHVWEGLGHAFLLNGDLPESREAYGVIARFFTRRLGSAASD